MCSSDLLGAPVFAFVLVAGALADRGNRRRMLLTTQIGGVVVLSISALMVWSGVASVPLACVVAGAFGMVAAFSQPVRSALTPMLVPRPALMHAIVVMTIGSNTAMIVGPLVAGSVIDRWGVGWAFAVQASFFVVGVGMVSRLRVPALPPREHEVRLRTDVADGLRFVWHHPRLRPLFVLLSVGGGYWVRFMNEHNSRLTRTTNDYTLDRFRLYTDWWYSDSLRVYGEYLWADAFAEDLTPLPLDANRGDILNLFVDLKLFDYEGKPVFVRGGRQEMLYGSQRLISTLEWANTRRTFEGVKLFRQGEHWDVDAFWVQPVIPRADKFDATDENQNLIGGWATYRPKKGEFIDFYYLGDRKSTRLNSSHT